MPVSKDQFLKEYKGSFPFLLDLQAKFAKQHCLTMKQWAAVEKCQVTEERREAQKASAPIAPKFPATYCRIPLILKRRGAKMVKDDNSLPLYPFTVTAEGIVARTGKATLVDISLTTGSVTVCRCCGKDLTDVRSQATGIGPVCAKRYHIPYPKDASAPEIAKFKLDLENLAKSIGVLRTWIPNRQIKSGAYELSKIVIGGPTGLTGTLYSPTTPVNQVVSAGPFKVGDFVSGKTKAEGNTYSTTGCDMMKGQVIEIQSNGRIGSQTIKVQCLIHKLETGPFNAYWVDPEFFNPFIDIQIVKFADSKFRWNPKTKTFSVNRDEVSSEDFTKLTEFAIESTKTGLVAIFRLTKTVTTLDGDLNCWEFEFKPDSTTKVKMPMKAVIFND